MNPAPLNEHTVYNKDRSSFHLGNLIKAPSSFFHGHRKKIIALFLLIIILLILTPFAIYIYFASAIKDKQSIINTSKTGLTLLDASGQPFATFFQPKQITYIPISNIPKAIQDAAVASEDKGFYTNPGFSITGIARAFLADIFAGKIVEGGSTITQELVKNDLVGSSETIFRKYQELVLAYELNRRFSKQDILEIYLNSVYYGQGAFGIQNAAESYFGIPAHDLDLAQSALLISLLPAPSAYSPLSNNPNIAKAHQQIVLEQMYAQHLITKEQENLAISEKLVYYPNTVTVSNQFAPHFAQFVKNQVLSQYGEERVVRDGFVVKTTLNSSWQEYAQEIVHNNVLLLRADQASNAAAVVIDPTNGEIKVMVGSYDWNDPQFGQTNMAVSPRQPGSSFKPIVYSYALTNGLITASSILQDVKTTFPGNYTPHDYDYSYRGPVTVRRALANSLNIPAVEVMNMVGVQNTLYQAQKFGISTLGTDSSKYGLSLVLGAGEVPLYQLTEAYGVFANQGVYNKPTAILSIQDKYGNTIYNYTSSPTQVISDGVAYIISSILSDDAARAEEFDGALTINRIAAVKTGTTTDFRDAWTIGYTPSLVVGVWVGNNDNSPMNNVAGSLGAAPIWRYLMEEFLNNTPLQPFIQPPSVATELVCPYQGLKTTYASSAAFKEYYLVGSLPAPCGTSLFPTINPTNPVFPTGIAAHTIHPTPTPVQP